MTTKAKTKRTARPVTAKASKTAKDAMHFEWTPLDAASEGEFSPEDAEFDKVARRLMAAVDELNAALVEAHKNEQMAAEVWRANDARPAEYHYRIYRLTHSKFTLRMADNFADEGRATGFWKGRKMLPVEKSKDGTARAA